MANAAKIKQLGKSVLRWDALGSLATTVTSKHFRIVSYHGVPDAEVFAKHVDYYASHWTPVSGEQVRHSLRSGEKLPPNALWVTFDDGESSVIRNALDSLTFAGVPATLYVCPGLVSERKPFWWRVIDEGIASGVLAKRYPDIDNPVAYLKLVGDSERRNVVDETWELLDEATQNALVDEVASLEELKSWRDAGLEIGNHSWDHPLLDQLDDRDQQWQVVESDEWFKQNGFVVNNFAFPNGNYEGADGAAMAIGELNYELAVLHDHKLAPRDSDPLHLSRLKVEADDPVDRLKSIVTGVQPALKIVMANVRRSGGS